MLAKVKMAQVDFNALSCVSCHSEFAVQDSLVAAYRSLWVGAFVRAELKGEKWYLGES